MLVPREGGGAASGIFLRRLVAKSRERLSMNHCEQNQDYLTHLNLHHLQHLHLGLKKTLFLKKRESGDVLCRELSS